MSGPRPITETKTIDPCTIATPDQLKTLLSAGIGGYFPLRHNKGGEHITISDPRLTDVTCPQLHIAMFAHIRYRQTRGFPQLDTSGHVRFASPLVAQVTTTLGQTKSVRAAKACLTHVNVTELDLKNVPNWLDNTWIRAWLNGELPNRMCFDITSLVNASLQHGGSL